MKENTNYAQTLKSYRNSKPHSLPLQKSLASAQSTTHRLKMAREIHLLNCMRQSALH